MKFFELMASGRPLVISPLPALAAFYDQVAVACSADEFVACCDDALRDSEVARAARLELASKHTWSARIDALMGDVERRLAEKVRLGGPRA